MSEKNVTISAAIPANVKAEAAAVAAAHGMSLAALLRELLARVAARDAEQVLVTAAVGSDVPELLDGSRFEITAGQIATTAFSSHRTDDV